MYRILIHALNCVPTNTCYALNETKVPAPMPIHILCRFCDFGSLSDMDKRSPTHFPRTYTHKCFCTIFDGKHAAYSSRATIYS